MASDTETSSPLPATTTIPSPYRLVLTTIEPLLSVGGAILVLANPGYYLSSMTRHLARFAESTRFLYTGMAGSWLYFAFVEAVVLRCFDDERLWRVLCAGMLLSDGLFCHSVAQAVGGWAVYARVWEWTAEEHAAFWMTAPMVATRVLVVLGVGLKAGGGGGGGHRKMT